LLYRIINSMIVMLMSALITTQAHADITNIATVTGSYGTTTVDAEDDEAVSVAVADPDLTLVKSVAAPDISANQTDRADAGDTITYTFEITNDGNVTMDDVSPVDTGPTFNGQTGTGSLGAFEVTGTSPVENTATLAPGESATFTAVYTMSELDVLHAADTKDLTGTDQNLIDNTAQAAGTTPSDTPYTDPDTDTAETLIAPFPEIDLVKLAVLNDEVTADTLAEVGETITYTYTVTNTGNVPLTNISLDDVHEGTSLTAGTDVGSETLTSDGPLATGPTAATSTDVTANDGVWDVIQPGAVVTFTYVHTVSQTEVDNG